MEPVKTNVFSYVKWCPGSKIEGDAWWDTKRGIKSDVSRLVYNTVNIQIWNKVYFGPD